MAAWGPAARRAGGRGGLHTHTGDVGLQGPARLVSCGWDPPTGQAGAGAWGWWGWRRSGKADAQSGRRGLFLPQSPKREAISRPALCALPTHVTFTTPPARGRPLKAALRGSCGSVSSTCNS